MIRQLVIAVLAACVVPGVLLATEDTSKVLGSIEIAAGEHAGDLSTVNGSIHIHENAIVGHATTVNGGLHLDPHATASSLDTVNGGVHIGEGARITGTVHTVNGGIHMDNGSEATGEVSNVNGGIQLTSAHVGGNIMSVSGDVTIGANSHVDGGIKIEKNESGSLFHFGHDDVPTIVIGPGAVVKGPLTFERKVRLFVSDRATIGPVQGATPEKFSGDRPPL
jgi:acetyltransferase-like isoleucine patch superfamily enzyme